MKNIVIAAGYATRLGELTRNFPKPLLKIGQSTILGRMLDDIDQIPDIDEHIIITNHKFAPIFQNFLLGSGPKTNPQGPGPKTKYPKDTLTRGLTPELKKRVTIVDDGTETNETRLGAVCDLLFAMAIKWGLLYRMTGNLYTGMADHFFNNCVGTNLLHVITDGGVDELMIVRVVIAQLLSFALVLAISRKTKGNPDF